MKRKNLFTTSLFAVALFLAWPLPAQGSFEWKSASPKSLGLDQKKIGAFLAELPDTLVTSCVIVKDGTIASEYYKAGCGADSVFSMQSVSKSVTSAVVGIAIQQGYFKLDDAISQFFPEAKNLAVCRGESKALFEKITVRHLLTNTSGLVSTDSAVWGQWRASGDWIKFLFDRPMLHEPGKVFEYSTGNTHLLAAIVQRTTKKSLDQYGRQVLFEPLGMQGARFDAGPEGVGDGGNGFHMTACDMARFGLLYLQGGVWQGKRIVPVEWVEESIKIQVPKQARYGFQWWVRWFGKSEARGFFAHGWGEQVIAVLPSKNLVVTFSSREPDNRKNATYWRWIGDIADSLNL